MRQSGVDLIIEDLIDLIKRDGKIKVIFGNEFGITDLNAILSLKEIGANLKYYCGNSTFHPKGYIFKSKDTTFVLIGSSNISNSAFINGIEWNMLFDSSEFDCDIILNEFNRLWNSCNSKTLTDQIIKEI